MPSPLHRDHYATLGLRRNASQQEVKRAYRDLAKQFHPDVDGSPLAAERFMTVHRAYATLHDPLLRLAYDASLTARDQRTAPRPQPSQPREAPRYRQREEDDMGPDINTRSWAFIGLHLTGLVFGLVLVLGILTGITFRGWAWPVIFFILPGLVVIPDAWEGLRMARMRSRAGRM